MELGLTLGEAPPPKPFSFSPQNLCSSNANPNLLGLDFGFCMSLGRREEGRREQPIDGNRQEGSSSRAALSSDPPLQLELMPFSPVPRSHIGLPWPSEQGNSEGSNLCLDVNRPPSAEEQEDGPHSRPHSSSPPAAGDAGGGAETERALSRASDEDENGLTRKKLRLSREQSAFLEESFKEHNTLNPKQKLALAKQLNLRPRQVEVWFQNRRARTKLKQTEVDCEYLKRCCEKLTEENRRLQKELQELRALKTSHPFYMHLPATTLTMCPSCERVASTTTTNSTNTTTATTATATAAEGVQNASTSTPSVVPSRPRFYPFVPKQNQSSVGS